MSPIDKFLLSYLLIINLSAYIAFYRDKQKAVHGEYRTHELDLLLFSIAGGPFGSLFAMNKVRHKTKHPKFKLLVPLFCLLWSTAIGYYLVNGLP